MKMFNREIFDTDDTAKSLDVHRNMIARYVQSGRLKPILNNKRRKGDLLLFSKKELTRFKEVERPKIKVGRPRKGGDQKC